LKEVVFVFVLGEIFGKVNGLKVDFELYKVLEAK